MGQGSSFDVLVLNKWQANLVYRNITEQIFPLLSLYGAWINANIFENVICAESWLNSLRPWDAYVLAT